MKKNLACHHPFFILSLVSISIILIQIGVNLRFDRPDIYSRFTGLAFKPKLEGFFQNHQPSLDQLTQVEFPFKVAVNAPETSKTIFFEMAYQCQPECVQLWLVLDANPELRLLIDHPGMRKLAWFFTSNGQQQLYQKNLQFPDPQSLLESNFSSGFVVDSQYQAEVSYWGKLSTTLESTNDIPPDTQIVLSTYQFPKHKGNWHLARRIDVSHAKRNSQGQIQLTLIHHSPEGTPAAQLHVSKPLVSY